MIRCICDNCSISFFRHPSQIKGRKNLYCSKLCKEKSKENRDRWLKEKAPRWNGGKTTNRGYIQIYQPSHPNADIRGYVFEHRLVMEKHLKRLLDPVEVVHHVNHNRKDNRIENLQLLENSSRHGLIHYSERKIDRKGRFI